MQTEYYTGTNLLSALDLNGNRPEIFIATSNRSSGKTFFFSKFLLRGFLKKRSKFMLLYRYSYELDQCADKFFKDIHTKAFPNDTMTSKIRAKGLYHELYVNDMSCGYAVTLNSADTLKKYSHYFNDTGAMFLDEFQLENNNYCANEVEKLISLHMSVARGYGEQSRYVPVYMCSNATSIINPYFTALGISNRLTKDTKILRGNGWVLEQNYNPHAAKAQEMSAFNQAFSSNSYIPYATQSVYLNDNQAFVQRIKGESRYLATVRFKNVSFAIREFEDSSIIYCDKHPDASFPLKISVTTEDHNINYVLLKNNDYFLSRLRYFFEKGCFRFFDLQCKEAILNLLSY